MRLEAELMMKPRYICALRERAKPGRDQRLAASGEVKGRSG